MKYELRSYQREAVESAIKFFNDDVGDNGLLVLPTGSGKSLIISEIAHRLNANVLVFCPSKEITEQNYEKMLTYTDECSMYSASVGMKEISRVTFATIGSVKNIAEQFADFDYIMVDEAHLVNGEQGMYVDFFSEVGKRVLGLTATPFRLHAERYYDKEARAMRSKNSMLVMLTNEDDSSRFFDRIIYSVQVSELMNVGYLANLQYFDLRPKGWNENKMFKNSTGAEYSDSSVRWMMQATNHLQHLAGICDRLLYNIKSGVPRNGILVFVQFVEDAEQLCQMVDKSAFITGETTKNNRKRILDEFRDGTIKVLVNVGTLTTGLDIPKLDTVVMGRPTLSLSLYYQCVGRAMRPYENKNAWVIDTVGNFNRFGAVKDLYLGMDEYNQEQMYGYAFDYNERRFTKKQLTGIYLN